MFDITPFKESLEAPEGMYFTPFQAQLSAFECEHIEDPLPLSVPSDPIPLEPPRSVCRTVVSLDASSRILGEVEGGVVAAVRACVVVREVECLRVERYGPYVIACTSTNSERIYQRLRRRIIGADKPAPAPHYSRMPDRVRNFLEKLLLKQAVFSFRNSLILYDGSMRIATYDTPTSFFKVICKYAIAGGNDVVAVSKQTGLTMRPDGRSILSALDGTKSPCCVMIKPFLMQDSRKYYGDIYVCRFVDGGDAFRVDLPPQCRDRHASVLSEVGSLANPFGYPEDLMVAHVMSTFYPTEIIGLQSAAAATYGMHLKENLRKKILGPLG
jgi:hypothetical protein